MGSELSEKVAKTQQQHSITMARIVKSKAERGSEARAAAQRAKRRCYDSVVGEEVRLESTTSDC